MDRQLLRDGLQLYIDRQIAARVTATPPIENVIENPATTVVNEVAPAVIPPVDVTPIAAALAPLAEMMARMCADMQRQARANDQRIAMMADALREMAAAIRELKIDVPPAQIKLEPAAPLPKREIEIVRKGDDRIIVREV